MSFSTHTRTLRRTAGHLLTTQPTHITALFLLWWTAMLAVPIAQWTVGPASIPITMLLGVIAQAGLVAALLVRAWGWTAMLRTAALISLLGWAAEAIGTATGYPFGTYEYTDLLQPQIAHVPLLIPLAWFMMMPVCWAIAQTITGRSSLWRMALISAATMTAWDLFLDPQMVAWNFWVWTDIGPLSYFGIPLLNYGGWLLTAFIMTIAARPADLSAVARPLWLVYAVTWFLETFGLLFFWGLPGPAVIGALGMGVFMLRGRPT